jgi:hypothetical protein
MKLFPVAGLVVASTLFLAPAAGAVELITNGGFELGTFTPSAFPTYDIITASGPQDLTSWTVGNSLVWGKNTTDINPHLGQGFVDLTGVGNTVPHGILNQTISTIVGQQYAFSVFTTLDIGAQAVGITVTANGTPISLSGAYGVWNYSPTGAIWRPVGGTFTASGSSTVLRIAGQPGFSFMIGVDDVSVTGPAVAAVPEPSTWAMMLIGFAGLAWTTRRRRQSPPLTA